MGIPATIEFLSSLRSSLQLLVIKNRIKTATKKPKGIKLKFTQNIYMRTLKQAYVMCRISGTWHSSSTVNITIEEFS